MTQEVLDGQLGDVATRLLHEDDRVKIWELVLEPGEQTAPHEHTMDYILVVVEGDRIAGVPHVRSTGASASYIEADVKAGSWHRLDKGGIEAARNTGTKTYREILIELKD
jgi:predicted metal-dependent enzyme (double-stranded beta helix superfamily)